MNEEELRKRISAGEDSMTEFKRVDSGSLPPPDDVAKALSAFANSGGGDLVFGVDDEGNVTGVGDRAASDRLQRHIAQVASDGLTPPLPARTLAVEVEGRRVVVAHVPEFLSGRPFKGRLKYFIRDGNASREARPEELKRILVSAPMHYFDEQSLDKPAREVLDEEAAVEFLREAYPSWRPEQTERYLQALHAVDTAARATVAGVVLFGRQPSDHLPGAYVSAVRFAGRTASGAFADAAEIKGDVFRQLRETVAFLVRHTDAPSVVEGLARAEQGVPLEVWREAVANALTHRDYASPNQVRVFVFDDRVEITNPGGLLNSLTLENIRLAGTKQPRNPHIATAVARRALRENLGIGVPEIFRLVVSRGLPEPTVAIVAGEFRLTVFTRG